MDTLAQHKTRPLTAHIDFSGADLRGVVGDYPKLRDTLKSRETVIQANPESDALWFYTQQHALSLIARTVDEDEPLGEFAKFVDVYHSSIKLKALRMFYYLLMICIRESRHAKDVYGALSGFVAKHPGMKDFYYYKVKNVEKLTVVANLVKEAPKVTMGQFTEFLVGIFEEMEYSGGFGGEAWADVANPLNDFVHGRISAEILLDTAFTLAHNNGPIFNKGMLYNNYTSLSMILDVQRSGQIPQLIANHANKFGDNVDAKLRQYVEDFSKLHSGFDGTVDWEQVKDIHGDAIYHEEIKEQKAANAAIVPPLAKMKAKVAAIKLTTDQHTAAIEIMPGVFVKKAERSMA